MKIPRLRTRLIALAIGVVLVVGSIGRIVRSAATTEMSAGIGGLLCQRVFQDASRRRMDLTRREISPGVWIVWDDPYFVRTVQSELSLLEDLKENVCRDDPTVDGIQIHGETYRPGIWGPTRERTVYAGWYSSSAWYGAGYVIDYQSKFALALQKHLASWWGAPRPGSWIDASLLANGRTERSRVLWSGYAINAATIVGLGLMGWGAPGAFAAVRAGRRIGKDQCAMCAYDLRGLAGEADRCPECGGERMVHDVGEPPTVSPAPPLL